MCSFAFPPAFIDYHLPADWEAGRLIVLESYCCYSFDTSVTLTATPSGEAAFSWWFGDVLESQRGLNPVTVVMDAPRSVLAAFGGGAPGASALHPTSHRSQQLS